MDNMGGFTGVKVFSATMHQDRDRLGEKVSDWLRSSKAKVVDTVVVQSSDEKFHCVTIVVFYN